MSAIASLFEQAQLAESAYGNFLDAAGNLIATSGQLETALTTGDSKFSDSQAASFVKNWEVIDHVPDTIGGFSATLFRNRQSGACTLAIRGSLDMQDFVEDAKIIFREGLAKHQLVDLYNFWVRANTPAGQGYDAARLIEKDVPFAGAIQIGLIFYGVEFVPSAQLRDANLRVGTGALAVPPAALSVTGHSLGGHLAMAFTRLFPGISVNALGINGLGFKIGASEANYFFAKLGGASSFRSNATQNIYGIAGPEFAAMNNGILQQPGGYSGLFIENASINPLTGFPSHSSMQMTDSAAVYDLFIKLDSSLRSSSPNQALETLAPVFNAASAQGEDSLERLVNT